MLVHDSHTEIAFDLRACARLWETLLPCCSDHIWMSPGNRSSPLVQALFAAQQGGLCTVHTHFDERGMAFAALGAARASGLPVVLLCTSGSAVANLLPALVEARAQGLRLVALTADRPNEEVHRSCPQTWPHLPLLQGAVVRSWSFPCPPDEDCTNLEELVHALREAPGPLHVNLPFSEPFGVDSGQLRLRPLASPHRPRHNLLQELPPELEAAWRHAKRPLVTLGASWEGVAPELVASLKARGALVLADVLSQHAFQGVASRLTEVAVERLQQSLPADLWIHLGGSLVSRSFTRLITQWRPATWVVSEQDLWWDPAGVHPRRWGVSPRQMAPDAWSGRAPGEQVMSWPRADTLRVFTPPPDEALPILQAFATTPSEGIFFVGNSMPIRHLVEHAPERRDPPRVWANRGVNGIDGNLATALGMAACQPLPVTVALGDLTTLHDLNSLALGHEAQSPPRFLVVNNGGGGIFRRVAAGIPAETWRRGFVTPHPWTFQGAAQQFGWAYSSATQLPELAGVPLLWEPPLARV
jgi:2-succinyl-5-enolpyruvyl-6-hydroxy-3-cyclohexene-1-carboxylate synthase